MDRREFFKLAGVGAGALLVAPQFALPEPEGPIEPVQEPSISREVGYIYRGNTQVAAVANCTIEMHTPVIEVSSREYMPYRDFTPGKPEVSIYGDLLPLEGSSTRDLMGSDEMHRIILAYPDRDIEIDTEGILTSVGLASSMNKLLVFSFTFQVVGEAHINYTS